jgi:hypothetical protein
MIKLLLLTVAKIFVNTATQNGHQRTVVAEPPLQEKSVSSSSPESPQVHVTIEVEETARL